MIEIQGNCCKDIKIFTDNIEDAALQNIYQLSNSPMFKDNVMRIMPDVHAGKGCTIGTCYPIKEYLCPAHVGVDIGCTVSAVFFDKPLEEKKYAQFERRLKKEIPTGFEINKTRKFEMKEFLKFFNTNFQKAYQTASALIDFVEWKTEDDIEKWCDKSGIEFRTFIMSLQTLGGGNHYLEYDVNDELKKYCFCAHTGSRNIGKRVCEKWMSKAKGIITDKETIEKEVKEFVANFKGDKTEIPEHIKKIHEKYRIPESDGYLTGDNMRGYLTDMVICQIYAQFNHLLIRRAASNIMFKINGAKAVDEIITTHNYVDFRDHILRKSAIRSYKGERMIIPFNMKDGIAICEGKSNEDWLCSACHGAGRLMSRSAAKKNIDFNTFQKQMNDAGIYSTSVCKNTLDEAPDAYKPMEEIVKLIEPTCDILYFMKPKINIKATDSGTIKGKNDDNK